VLVSFGKIFKKSFRTVDIVGRYGGEEFIAILPGIELEKAVQVAERFREEIFASQFKTTSGEVNIMISLGIASIDRSFARLEELIIAADKLLYKAKNLGRNQVAY
jgi:diguanylate cyclase (GGDEF)-like protein